MADLAPQNINELHEAQASWGDKVADRVTLFVGSWKFVIFQSLVMTAWVVYNTYVVLRWAQFHAFDPFPFVFLNLFMSAEAAYSTPFILMSQNRQAERDRLKADEDFRVNKHADGEVDEILAIVRALKDRASAQDIMKTQQ